MDINNDKTPEKLSPEQAQKEKRQAKTILVVGGLFILAVIIIYLAIVSKAASDIEGMDQYYTIVNSSIINSSIIKGLF